MSDGTNANLFSGTGEPLAEGVFVGVLADTGLEPAALWSVLTVETTGCGYLFDRRPKMLFERHIFSRLTSGSFDTIDPDLSNPSAGGYRPGGSNQYVRLNKAIALNRNAALESASWGLGQIMGENAGSAGFVDVEQFVSAMVASENNQLSAMMQFLRTSGALGALLQRDWAGFARRYNGPNFARNNYDGLLEHFYFKFQSGGLPDLRVRAAQVYLSFKGFPPGPIDGLLGQNTVDAIKAYQASIGVQPNGTIDDALLKKLEM